MIIITGVSRGIGRFLWNHYQERGEEILGIDKVVADDLSANPSVFALDITDAQQLVNWAVQNRELLRNITLINCAGINYNSFAHKADPMKWQQVIHVNLVGTFNMIYSLLGLMREQKWGRIINFASVVAQTGVPGTSAYAASKSGLWGLSKSLAKENASQGITINSLNLGYFDVGMIQEVPSEMQQKIKDQIPSGAFGDPENIFRAIQFLRECDYINGTALDISAGLV